MKKILATSRTCGPCHALKSKIQKAGLEVEIKEYSPDTMEWFVKHNIKSVPRQQYTGLKDKNGVEVYEGDIVQYDNMDGEVGNVGMVEWVSEEDGWDFTGWRIYRTFTQHGPFKVIGNIFENPELLK